ncbi:hybrid sensor histidine kinase/response regulator transcription factor [Pleomorphovibrio marinus]|uniref:hybrid sensor histidine kinase/response regulator transcription factor n=1 Tax=Pleomorphovibrio marinus TaxID=2164132 RepID=UPI000E0B114A|nr:hybrid sensor histidine kinase/response regulator transcription factor [Pleomorphovibrio marinus]
MIRFWNISLILVAVFPGIGMGQHDNISFNHLTINDGLSHNNVVSIIQDKKGFIWIGTQDGLNRFDGYTFKAYQYSYKDTSSLSKNPIRVVYEDGQGFIWVGTSGGGLNRFDPWSETFSHITLSLTSSLGEESAITTVTLVEDRFGYLWAGTMDGLFRIDLTSFEAINVPLGEATNTAINKVYLDSEESLWVGTFYHGLFKIRLEENGNIYSESLMQWKHDENNEESLGSNTVMSIIEDHKGFLWIAHINGLDQWDKKSNIFHHFKHNPEDSTSISTNYLSSSMAEDALGNLWVSSSQGLNKLGPDRKHFSRYCHDPNDPNSLSSNEILPILIDKTGVIWIGTINGGINRMLQTKQPFDHYKNDPEIPFSLKSNHVRVILEDSEEVVWVGTEGGGLNKLDRKNNTFYHYLNDPHNPISLMTNNVSALLEDRNGVFWIGYAGGNYFKKVGGLSVMDRDKGEFTHIPIQASERTGSADREVLTIFEDSDGYIWVGTQDGLKKIHPRTKKIEHFFSGDKKEGIISDHHCLSIFEDRLGYLWIGTGSIALNRMNRKTGEIIHYSQGPLNPNSISSHSVRHIQDDSKGNLWLATYGGGLCHFDLEKEIFTAYTIEDGLPGNTINRIEIDAEGNLWLSTNKGICRFNPITKEILTFDASDGLQSNQFATGHLNLGSSFKGKDGRLYFGGINGLNAFYPDQIRVNEKIPPIVITEFRVLDQPLSGWKEKEVEGITLAHQQKFISFEFSALNFINSHKNQYAYKLENFDEDWIYSGTRRYASYTNLNPGNYVFRVKGSNNDGVWNETGTSMAITILPPWWQTWWAYSLYVALGILTLLGMRKAVVNRERLKGDLKLQMMEAEKMHELDRTKSSFFANISHEFRTPLTLISGTVEKLKNKDENLSKRDKDYGLIHRNASRLHQLINQLLDLSKLEAGKLKVDEQPGEIVSFLRRCAGSFVSLFESKQITYKIEMDESLVYVYFDSEKLEKIISNLLSNAFKFTPKGGEVVFRVDVGPLENGIHHLQIAVKDTGIGIPKEKLTHIFERFYQVESASTRAYEGTGIGLSLVHELVRLQGGDVSVISEPGQGSVFELTLPLKPVPAIDIPLPKSEIPLTLAQEPNILTPYSTKNGTFTPPKSHRPLVLVVEDNPEMRQFIGENLKENYRISEAENGKIGIEKAVELMPDLILSDVMMPDLDGVTLSDQLKKDERTSHIPIILLTARADKDSKLDGLETGADDYLTKPFQMEELLVRIKNLIKSRKLLRMRYSQSFSLEPSEITVTSTDERLLTRLLSIMEDNLSNPEFDVERLSREIGMSRVNLHRKLKALIDQAPTEFIRTFRMKRAACLLAKDYGNISEVAFNLGFNSLTYFSRSFKQYYGVTPTEFVGEKKRNKEVGLKPTPFKSKI